VVTEKHKQTCLKQDLNLQPQWQLELSLVHIELCGYWFNLFVYGVNINTGYQVATNWQPAENLSYMRFMCCLSFSQQSNGKSESKQSNVVTQFSVLVLLEKWFIVACDNNQSNHQAN
jgi:hypothetical protein